MKKLGVQVASPVEYWLEDENYQLFPNSTLANKQLVSLPIYPTLTLEEQKKVCEALETTLRKYFTKTQS